MKATRKLIPAIAMLLISAVMLSTASFAWFSMNPDTTATSMQITAKSDAEFLIINAGASFTADGTEISASATPAISLLPVKPKAAIALAAVTSVVETPANWEYAYSNDPSSPTAEPTSVATVSGSAASDLIGDGKYLGKAQFFVGLKSSYGVPTSANNLKLKEVTLPTVDSSQPLKAIVVVGGKVIHIANASNNALNVDFGVKANNTTGTEVVVYYYIDGGDAAVFTDNMDDLGNLTVSIKVGI